MEYDEEMQLIKLTFICKISQRKLQRRVEIINESNIYGLSSLKQSAPSLQVYITCFIVFESKNAFKMPKIAMMARCIYPQNR